MAEGVSVKHRAGSTSPAGRALFRQSVRRALGYPPAMPTVHVHHVQLLLIAHRSAQRAFEDSKGPDALTDDSLLAIVMVTTAAEAFINELAEWLVQHQEAASDWSP